ncbi:12049_t:CDS:2, partial [Funneliformis caledonium]
NDGLRDYAQLPIIINYDGKHPEKIKINRFNKMSKISISEESAIRTEIRKKIDDKTGPLFIRLAFHTLASFDRSLKTIALNFDNPRNIRLKDATKLLSSVEKNHKEVSKCDLWSLAGVIAVEVLGGPKIPWKFGRKDGTISEEDIPGISLNPDVIRKEFKPLGFTDRDIVAFIGAHTVGRSAGGKWTESNNRFTNQFSQLKGQYNILYTQESLEPSFSTAQLTFSANDPGNLSFSVIELLLLLRSTQTAMIYPGSIEGTNEQPNLGNFIIKRVAEVEKSLTGDWRGYYFYIINDESDRMLINLNFTGMGLAQMELKGLK